MSVQTPRDGSDVDAMLRRLGEAEPRPTAPPLGAALEAELAALSPRAPRRPHRQLALVLAGSLAYAGALLALLHIRADLAGLPAAWLVGYGAAWLASFTVLTYLAIVPRAGAVMPRWRHAGVAALVAAIGFVVAGFALVELAPSALRVEASFAVQMRHDTGCLEFGMLTALAPVLLGALLLRGAVPVGLRWTAAALGAAGGSLGGLMLHLHCPIVSGWHLAIGHGGVVALSAGLAALAAPAMRAR